jgi:ParB family chromosome partitioning protein
MNDRRRGLGRGLAALLPSEPGAVRTLPVGQLVPNRRQPRSRFDEAGLDELAESIRTQGVIQPIIVSPLDANIYTIIAGERRWRAAQRAGLAEVPVVVRQLRDDRQLLELALVENLQRTDLDPIEEAEAYRALADDFGLAHEEIATRVGRSRSAVSNALRLLRLPVSVQEMLRAGELTVGQARPLLGLTDADEIERLARRIVEQGLSARLAEELAAGGRAAGKRRRARPVEPHAAAAAERLTRMLQTRVEIERRGKGGVVKIHFHSEAELMRLFDALAARRGGGAT